MELSPQGEAKVEEGVLEQTLRHDLRVGPDFPVFVPAVTYRRGNRRTTIRLLEGYAFIGSGLPDLTYYGLENRSYVEKVMSTPTGPHRLRTLNTIPNSDIEDLKKKLKDELGSVVTVGDRVGIAEGTYKGLEGVVQGRNDENAFVKIDLRSMQIVATIPLAFLESATDEWERGVDVRVTSYVRYAGYISWISSQDKAIGKLFGDVDDVDAWYEGTFLGRKKIAWKKRRFFLGKVLLSKLPEDKTVFNISRRPDGAFVVRSR